MDDTRFAPWRRPLTTGDLQARAIALLQSGMDYRWPTDFRLRYGAPAADMPRPANASGGGMP
jgi:hypothetical protein